MAKEFFKNLPDTSTPLSASRLNGLLNGNEAMGSIVVEDIKCKNLLSDTMIIKIVNCSGTTKKIIQTSADTSNNLNWKIQTYLDDTTTSNPLTILNNEVGNISLTFKKFSTFNRVGFGLNGETKDTLIVFDATSLEDNKDYVISFELTDATQGSITIENIQLEEGVISTEYVPYKKFGYSSTETMGNIVVDDIKCKNLLNINARPYKTNYCDAIVSGDTLTTSGAGDNYVTYLINVKPNTDYTISVNSMNSGINIYDAEVSNYIAGFEIANGSSLTFNTGSHSKINIVFYGNDTYVKPQLEEGTTATEYTPYKAFGVMSGSNEKGNWIKYDDGTMIQWGTITKSGTIATYSNGTKWYYDDGYIVHLPQQFINDIYYANVSINNLSLLTLQVYSITNYRTELFKFNLSANVEHTFENYEFRWFTIGRWK